MLDDFQPAGLDPIDPIQADRVNDDQAELDLDMDDTGRVLDLGVSDDSPASDWAQNDILSILDGADSASASVNEELDISHPDREYDDYEISLLAEDPEFFESGKFYEQGFNEYGYNGTCGPTSMANSINTLLGTNELSENKVLTVAVENGLCDTSDDPNAAGGTSTSDLMELYDKVSEQSGVDINADLYEYEDALSVEQMAERLNEGSVLNLAVDSNGLWDIPRDHVNAMGVLEDDFASDHWITVTGAQKDSDGNLLGFDIIDSGNGVNYVDRDKLERICFGTPDHQVVDPTCIVLSKKPAA